MTESVESPRAMAMCDELYRRRARRSAARLAELQGRQSLRVSRATIDQHLASFGSRPGISRERIDVGGVPAHRFSSDRSSNDICVLFVHGGGFHTGSGDAPAALLGMLVEQTGASVVSCDYRLSPEHRYPAAVHDVEAVVEASCRTLGASRVAVVGSSAGANLALGALQRRAAASAAMPSALVLYSPLLDLRASALSYERNAPLDPSLSRVGVRGLARSYLGGHPADSPGASPLLGSAAGMCATLVFASESEVVHDDAVEWVRIAQEADVDAECVIEADLPHAWPTFAMSLNEAQTTIGRTAGFIRDHFGLRDSP